MNTSSIETKCIDGVWHAHWYHELLGHVDGRSGTERMAISNLMDDLRKKAEAFNVARYEQLKEKHPEHNWRAA